MSCLKGGISINDKFSRVVLSFTLCARIALMACSLLMAKWTSTKSKSKLSRDRSIQRIQKQQDLSLYIPISEFLCLFQPERAPDKMNETDPNVWQQLSEVMTPSIVKVVEFAKRVPGFMQVSNVIRLSHVSCSNMNWCDPCLGQCHLADKLETLPNSFVISRRDARLLTKVKIFTLLTQQMRLLAEQHSLA